jgi:hypothetical protein
MNLFATDGWRDSSSPMVATGERQPIEILSPKRDQMKRQKAFSLLQLLIELAMTVFIAGIVVPSLIRSRVATKEALAAGSLHTIKLAGVTLLFRYENIVVAILGVLVGGAAGLVVETERPIVWLRHLFSVLRGCLGGLRFGDDAARVLRKEDGGTKNARVVWEN